MKAELKIALAQVHALLQRRYGELTFVSGQGITQGQRVEFTDNGQRVRCLIKLSSGGRISFGRREDGTWSGLSDADRVVVVGPSELEGDDLTVSLFDQATLKEAFDANHEAQEEAGMGGLPNWIAPFYEDRGVRGTGDGFGHKALWTEELGGGEVRETATPAAGALQEAVAALHRAAAQVLPGAVVEVRISLPV